MPDVHSYVLDLVFAAFALGVGVWYLFLPFSPEMWFRGGLDQILEDDEKD